MENAAGLALCSFLTCALVLVCLCLQDGAIDLLRELKNIKMSLETLQVNLRELHPSTASLRRLEIKRTLS